MELLKEQLKTFEDACKIEGLDPDQVIGEFSGLAQRDEAPIIAFQKLLIIARAANKLANDGKPWVPDWTDYDQYKYYPWFEMRGASGFRFYDYVAWSSDSYVGSRLCYISRDVAVYVGKQFQDIYEQFIVIK